MHLTCTNMPKEELKKALDQVGSLVDCKCNAALHSKVHEA